jgi:hypothetical protein
MLSKTNILLENLRGAMKFLVKPMQGVSGALFGIFFNNVFTLFHLVDIFSNSLHVRESQAEIFIIRVSRIRFLDERF